MPDNSSSNKRIAKNSVYLSIRLVIVLILSLYTTRVVLSILGIEDYGIYNVVCGFVSLFAFLNTSMSNGIQRFYNYEYGKNGESGANKVYCTSLLIQFILAIIIIVVTECFGVWYLQNKLVIPIERLFAAQCVFQCSVINFLFIILQAPYTAAVIAHERLDFYAVVNVFDAVLKLAVVFLLPYITVDQLVLYGIFITSISVFNFIAYYVYCKRKFPEVQFHYTTDKNLFLKMLGFSGWNLFGSFSGVMKEQGVNLVNNLFFGPVVNAAQGISQQVSGGLQSFVSNITMPVRPQVVQSYAKGDLERVMNLTFSISKLSCGFLLMMAIPVSLEIDYILQVWLGDKVPEHANTFTIIILFTSITNNLNSATSGVVHSTGIMKDYQLWGSLISISSVPIAYFLLMWFHLPEIALLCVMVCTMLAHLVGLFIVKRLVGLSIRDYFLNVVWKIIIILVLSLTITYPFHYYMNYGFSRLCIVTLIGFSSVLTALFLVFNDSERKIVLNMIKSVKNKLI